MQEKMGSSSHALIMKTTANILVFPASPFLMHF